MNADNANADNPKRIVRVIGLAAGAPRLASEVVLPIRARRAPGRNEICRCGSGLKFKRCCRGKDTQGGNG